MWLGISKGLESHNGFDAAAGLDESADYLLAFSNKGTIAFIGKDPFNSSQNQSPPVFHSGQLVQFVLDTGTRTLKIKIDNDPKTEMEVTNVEDQAVRPFVCMDDYESADLKFRAYCVSTAAKDEASKLSTERAQNNTLWSPEVNKKLLEIVFEGGNTNTTYEDVLECLSKVEMISNNQAELGMALHQRLSVFKTFKYLLLKVFPERNLLSVKNQLLNNLYLDDTDDSAALIKFINLVSLNSRTVFHAAIVNVDALDALILCKADLHVLNCQDSHKMSPLHLAAKTGNIETILRLIEERISLSNVERDESVKTPLELAIEFKQSGCADALKGHGADGWTPLMLAAERGVSHVRKYLKRRKKIIEIFTCMEKQTDFTEHFERRLKKCQNTRPMEWTWGPYETKSMRLSENKLKISKVQDVPDYSCALGSEAFAKKNNCIYVWNLLIEDVTTMWLGVALGVEERGGLDSAVGLDCDFLIAFNNRGESIVHGISQKVEPITSFFSGQKIKFILDMAKNSFMMKIDGKKAIHIKDIDIPDGIRPYICCDDKESATLLHRSCISEAFSSGSNNAITESEQRIGLENTQWTADTDSFLHKNFVCSTKFKYADLVRCYPSEELDELEKKLSDRLCTNNSKAIAARLNVLGCRALMLMDLVNDHNAEKWKGIIVSGNDINMVNTAGSSALHIAAKNGHSGAVNALIECEYMKLPIDNPDKDGISALHIAIQNSHFSVIARLIEASADLSNISGESKSGCCVALKRRGAYGWTPLMVAAETGSLYVRHYLHLRDKMRSNFLPDSQSLSLIMPSKIKSESNSPWTWGNYHTTSMFLDDEMTSVSKIKDAPDYSCALGSKFLNDGIHSWDILVYNVENMWVGIAQGAEINGLDSSPSVDYCEYMFVFKNNGRCPPLIFPNKTRPELCYFTDARFRSGQRVNLTLDVKECTLSMKIDGVLAAKAINLVVQNARPYVCMDSFETAILENVAYIPANEFNSSKLSTDTDLNDLVANSELVKELLIGKSDEIRIFDLIKADKDINSVNENGRTALHIAVENGQVDAVSALCSEKHRIPVHLQDVKKKTALHIAAESENLQHYDPTQVNIIFKLLKASELDGVLDMKDSNTDKIIDIEDENNFTALDIILEKKKQTNVARITHCEHALKMLGSRKWTPLILAAEMTGDDVESHLRIQEILQCEHPIPSSSLPQWLTKMVQDYSKLCLVEACSETQLKFDLIHEATMKLFNTEKRQVTKTDDTSDYSCALGLLNFDYKLHSWEISVKNVKSIWLGVMTLAMDTTETELEKYLNSSPEKYSSSGPGPCTLAFSCDGKCTLEGAVDRIGDTSFCSEQKVEFELDLIGRELTMKVADSVAAIARNLDISRKFYIYVCLGYRDESVTLEKSISYNHDSTDKDNTNDLGMDNCFWGNLPKTDQTLSRLAGCVTLMLDPYWERDIPDLSLAWATEHAQKSQEFDDTEVQSIFSTRLVYHYLRGKLLGQRNISKFWIKKILENGYIDCKNYLGKPAIYYAVKNNDVSSVIKLLDAGACVNYEAESLLLENSAKTRCFEILKEGGADNWTPLMIASQKGTIQVQKYFKRRDKIRNILLSIQSKTCFPSWFEDKVDQYSNYKKGTWVWGKHVADGSMELSEGGLKAKRVKNTSGYSCALGSELLNEGIHKWGIVVQNVKSMWLGIAKGVLSLDSLPESDVESSDDSASFVLMFGNGGSTIMSRKHKKQAEVHNNTKFCSDQLIKFTLNTELETITMKVDGVLAVSVKGVKCKGVYPYVCLGYNESAIVMSRASLTSIKSRDSNQSALNYKDQEVGLNNSVWNRELNDESLQTLTDPGSVLIFTQREIDILQKKIERSTDESFQRVDLNLKHVAARLNVLGTIDQMLLKMTRVGNIRNLKFLILSEEDINATATKQQSSLHIAAACGHSGVIRALLERKADINQLDAENKSALILAGTGQHQADTTRITKFACEDTLKSFCADSWTPLMLAVINSQANVTRYFKWREVLLCVKKGRPFPNWFADKVLYYSRIVTGNYWSWDKIEEHDILSIENGLEVLKHSNTLSVSSCIGNVLSRERVTHIWAIKVDHVQNMWLGVVEESRTLSEEFLLKSPKKMGSEFMIAIHNDGDIMLPKKDPPCCETSKGDLRYYSGSTLEFKMNYSTGTLKVTIDGILRYIFSHIGCSHLRPYVCMERNESAKITSQAYIAQSEGAPPGIDQQSIDSGLNNSFWSDGLDSEIKSYFLADGAPPNFDPAFSKRIQSKYKTWSQGKSQIPKLNAIMVRLNALHVLENALSSVCITPAGVEWLKSMVADSDSSDLKVKNKQGNSALDLASKDKDKAIVDLLKLHQDSDFSAVSSPE
uniref:PARP n=1 Tax=Cryptomonas curvata TaxID=233186 RepID=A0A7S0M3A1_9CRYP